MSPDRKVKYMIKKDNDICQIKCIHLDKVKLAKEAMPADELIRKLAELYRTMGDPTRLKIIQALQEQELCVCDLSAVVEVSESAVSHQLRLLRAQKLLKFRREGKVVYYSLDDQHIAILFEQGLEHIKE
jgi:DNA-binding transcriptional ArsR family regulator